MICRLIVIIDRSADPAGQAASDCFRPFHINCNKDAHDGDNSCHYSNDVASTQAAGAVIAVSAARATTGGGR
jgi:hypothetical protein